jgi:hypothetical protein
LVPALPWLGGSAPGKPKLTLSRTASGANAKIIWAASGSGNAWLWLVQTRHAGQWTSQVLPGTTTAQTWNNSVPDAVAVSAVDRKGNISRPAAVSFNRQAR